ncbi:FtsX-like permease family protein [Rudanella paleaurantiibacter]|uniref:FtsX-like permease family protein n=1 Tax=Rudanella paleaurantiibacter TaxID=2614655 RepID=A0A7J5U0W6_9BACT|nr:ABC transporter permease [Rudanella paleaurantiibacter]KAB7731398.1 FtsX-like permease family protein [Rudanella paleaurantiibacter]
MFRTAYKFIRYDKAKSLGALAGIVISVFLVGQQAGLFIFLTDAMRSLVDNNKGYIWVTDETTTNANQLSLLDTRKGNEIASLPGVERVYPVVVATVGAKFANGKTSGMALVGSQAPGFVGGPWRLYTAKPQDMLPDGAIITDFYDAKAHGGLKPGDYFEINGKKVYNAGLTRGARSFGGGLLAFTTIERARYLGNVSTNKVSFYLVRHKPGVTETSVIQAINGSINGVRAWNADALSETTVRTVLATNGIAASFGSLIGFAIISGLVIIGLTLYSAAIDRIKDYGTLKAIGATNGYISRLILMQAFLFAVVGFVVGRGLVEGFRYGIAQSGTLFYFPGWFDFALFAVTILISLGGSVFAIRRINSLEPATVFRG